MLLLMFISAALAGNLTAAVLLLGKPAATYRTAHKVEEVALCISNNLGPVSVLNYGTRDAITSRDRASGVAIDLEAGTARVWRVNGLDEETRRVVETCLNDASEKKS